MRAVRQSCEICTTADFRSFLYAALRHRAFFLKLYDSQHEYSCSTSTCLRRLFDHARDGCDRRFFGNRNRSRNTLAGIRAGSICSVLHDRSGSCACNCSGASPSNRPSSGTCTGLAAASGTASYPGNTSAGSCSSAATDGCNVANPDSDPNTDSGTNPNPDSDPNAYAGADSYTNPDPDSDPYAHPNDTTSDRGRCGRPSADWRRRRRSSSYIRRWWRERNIYHAYTASAYRGTAACLPLPFADPVHRS